MIIIESILVFLFVAICISLISEGINKNLVKKNKDMEKRFNALKNFSQSQINEKEILYKVLSQIYKDLKLLQLKDCPEEEFHNIPSELCMWIEELFSIKNSIKIDKKDDNK